MHTRQRFAVTKSPLMIKGCTVTPTCRAPHCGSLHCEPLLLSVGFAFVPVFVSTLEHALHYDNCQIDRFCTTNWCIIRFFIILYNYYITVKLSIVKIFQVFCSINYLLFVNEHNTLYAGAVLGKKHLGGLALYVGSQSEDLKVIIM